MTTTSWTETSILTFVSKHPESQSVEYLRPFEKQNPDLNRLISRKAEWNLISMANLEGGCIFIGIDERNAGQRLAPFKASVGEICLQKLLKHLATEARPAQPDFQVHKIALNQADDPEMVYVIEVAKSANKHYMVTREGVFYPMKHGPEIAQLEIIAAKNQPIAIDQELNDFIAFVKSYILPMFPGSYLAKSVLSSPNQEIAALDEEHQSILVKPTKDYHLRLMIARHHPFTPEDKAIVKNIVREVYNTQNTVAPEYRKALRGAALEIALCRYLSPPYYSTVAQIINGLTAWSIRTYEGRSAAFGIRVNLHDDDRRDGGEAIGQIIGEDYFAVLSDGRDTLIETNSHGQVLGHYSTHGKRINHSVLAPLQFAKMAIEAGDSQAVIVLTRHSELLIFINKELKFAKRRGVWLHFNHAPIIRLIGAGSKYMGESLRAAVYETLLDISFAKTGGTICICRKTSIRRLLKDREISAEDLFGHDEQSAKSRFLQHIIKDRKFQDIPRGLRQELLSVDGATIIDTDGEFICVGSIVKVRSGSPSGGRLAATQSLSKYGPSFKVSSDGMISAYLFKEHSRKKKLQGKDPLHVVAGGHTTFESRIETLFTIA